MKRFRVRAPELHTAGDWFNTPSPITLKSLRGRVVLVDFWTSGCVNCLHVIDELRPLEAAYPNDLVVIGVHSPKFAYESTAASVAAAIGRYGITHPVLSDPDLSLWGQYAVRAWPTLVLIDQQGYVVAQAAGEGQVSGLALVIDELVAGQTSRDHSFTRSLAHSLAPDFRPREPDDLYFPAKAVVLPPERTERQQASVLVANAGGHSLIELAFDGHTVLRRIGSGTRGLLDGDAAAAQFAEPNGVALLPCGLADFDVVVADTANHVLRGVRLSDGAVVATIDLSAQLRDARTITGSVASVLSPSDVAWWPAQNRLVVAAAGVHLLLSVDLVAATTEILAGTTVEGMGDGDALDGWLAQPSGLAVDGERLWFVDPESSSLRYLQLVAGGPNKLHTVVGEGLFDFGLVDGPAATARLQHPSGVTLLADGSLAVADTYNGAIRRYDPATDEVSTLATGLAEPSGAVIHEGRLLVVESSAHRLTSVDISSGSGAAAQAGIAQRARRAPTPLSFGTSELRIMFQAPPGRKLDDRDGPSTRLTVSASPPELLVSGGGDGTELHRTLELSDTIAAGVLQISAQAASCDDDPAIANPACHLSRQDWGIPIVISADGPGELTLTLFG